MRQLPPGVFSLTMATLVAVGVSTEIDLLPTKTTDTVPNAIAAPEAIVAPERLLRQVTADKNRSTPSVVTSGKPSDQSSKDKSTAAAASQSKSNSSASTASKVTGSNTASANEIKRATSSPSENSKDGNAGIGSTADLSEHGYAKVVAVKNDKEMESFVNRVINEMHLQVEKDAGLKGLVPYYSGVKAKQSLANLKTEIANLRDNTCDGWLVDASVKLTDSGKVESCTWTGFTAPLSEDGYIAIARLHNDSHMEKFIERTIVDLNYEITDVSGLLGLSPFHSCAKGAKTFDELKTELMTLAATPGQWVRLKGSATSYASPSSKSSYTAHSSSGKSGSSSDSSSGNLGSSSGSHESSSHSGSSSGAGKTHSADMALKRERFAKEMAAKRAEYNSKVAKEKEGKNGSHHGKDTNLMQRDASLSQNQQKLQQEQKLQKEFLMMKEARTAYDKKVEQEKAQQELSRAKKLQREFAMMKAAREAYDKKLEEQKRATIKL